MKKFNKQEIKQITKRLKPFWKKYWLASNKFNNEVIVLEKKMNRELSLDTELEFFYVDGECAGIGAKNYSDRESFPLIHDSELF